MSATSLYAVLIALDGDSLLLPNNAIAEVVSRDTVQAVDSGLPWWIGQLSWNGQTVPVVQLEVLSGRPAPAPSRRGRVVILHSLSEHYQDRRLAVVTQGYPHLVTLTSSAVKPLPLREAEDAQWVLSRCQIASQIASIPNLMAIDTALARAAQARGF